MDKKQFFQNLRDTPVNGNYEAQKEDERGTLERPVFSKTYDQHFSFESKNLAMKFFRSEMNPPPPPPLRKF